jgi:hypothetical protein
LVCGVCVLINKFRDPRPGVTLYKGLLVCKEHLQEAASSGSDAARAVKDLTDS